MVKTLVNKIIIGQLCLRTRDGIMESFVTAKTLFVLKRYDIANASIMPPQIDLKTYTKGKHKSKRIEIGDGRSLLFLTPTPLLQIQLRLQSDFENFSNIILRSIPILNFSKFGKPIMTSNSYFMLASFLCFVTLYRKMASFR